MAELTSEEMTQIIQTAMAGPSRVAGDAGSVEQRPLSELIEARKYFAAQSAAKRRSLGLRLVRLIPPGAF